MCYVLEKKIFKKIMPSRQEGSPYLKLFTLEDYPDMKGEKFSFDSNGNLLKGYKYYIDKKNIKAVIILHHGLGAGHTAYETFIHNLALQGYMIYAYDNACCGESEGSGWWNFSSSLIDQENFFKWFENDEDQKGQKRIVVGHSWGGFTAINGLRYKVDKIVAMSAFISVSDILTNFVPPLKLLIPFLKGAQKHYFGKYGNANSIKLLQSSNIPVLLMSGDKDDTVDFKNNFLKMKKKLEGKNNISYYVVKDRYHQPEMTVAAQNYYRELNDLLKKGKVKDFPEVNYDLLLEQDPVVLKAIYDFIDGVRQ